MRPEPRHGETVQRREGPSLDSGFGWSSAAITAIGRGDEYSFPFVSLPASLAFRQTPLLGVWSPAMALPCDPIEHPSLHLERCWRLECDIDPMILRLRLLRRRGCLSQVLCLEQELLPFI